MTGTANDTLTLSTEISEEDRDAIGEGLTAANAERVGPDGREDLWIVARDPQGRVVGGLKGQVDYCWLLVDWLWCDPDNRGRGLGSRLMAAAEAEACRRGWRGIYLQTATFQAPDFYRRLGYVEFGRLDELLPGHAVIWLQKRL
jgi:GNAT superfamily N-acetyltransferase